jgi:hypothetical protein
MRSSTLAPQPGWKEPQKGEPDPDAGANQTPRCQDRAARGEDGPAGAPGAGLRYAPAASAKASSTITSRG